MRFHITSIRTRLVFLTLGLLLPLLLAGFFNLWEFRNTARKQLDESLRQQAGLAATAFEQRIGAFRQTLEAVSILADNNESRFALQEYLDSIVKTRANWLDIQIVNGAGETVSAQSKKDSKLSPISVQPLVQEAVRENAFVISTEQFGGESLSLITLARPIANGNFVLARIDGASVSDVFRHLKFPEDHIIAVFDRNNRLLYRSRVSPEQMSLDVSQTPLLTALNERREGTIEVESPYDNISRVYGLARVETTDSVVLVGVPSARLYGPARSQFIRQLLLGLFLSLVGVAAAYAIALSITRPMRKLTRAAEQFGAGDMSARPDLADGGSIGQLGATFNEMAQQISKRENEFKELDRLKSDFVSNVSHELRTPLTTIKTLARVLQSDRLSAENRAEYLETISIECDRQINFVQGLLDLSRIESGAYKVSLVEVDVVKVLIDSVETQKGPAEIRNLKLSLSYPLSPLPLVFSDEEALRRIVSGVIDNAIKYSPAGSEIMIAASHQGDQIAIEISDAGCGIAAQDLPHIFEKFYRGRPVGNDDPPFGENGSDGCDSGTYNEVPGVGLGLYLVQSLVKQIGAKIEVESPPAGKASGSKFTILLPAADSPQ